MSKPEVPDKGRATKSSDKESPPPIKILSVPPRVLKLLFILALAMATLWVFWPLGNYGFINLDDDVYVYGNPRVKTGLTLKGIIWAFTTLEAGFWHPLTWLSHMLDCEIYGLNAGGHHWTNVLLHIASTLLLFLVLERMTRASWRSSLVAALFALHPLHVESVAWVAERKDVLCTFFGMLTLWTYVRYTERPGLNRYLIVLSSFVLGLLSKAMLITLPGVMLLLDYWPLRRFPFGPSSGPGNSIDHPSMNGKGERWFPHHFVLEKVPFFVLAAIFSFLTFLAEQSVGAIKSFEWVPLEARVGNALVFYLSYIGKMIWPHPLAVFYPHPGRLPMGQVVGAGLFLVGVSVLVVRLARKYPYLVVGWLWYLGTLVPVIGLVQVGGHGLADRYTYVPLIGLFMMMAWGVPEVLAGGRYRKAVLALSAGLLLSIFMVVTRLQIQQWHDSITLFTHTLRVTPGNSLIHTNLGLVLAEQGKIQEAIAHYTEALRIDPKDVHAHNNLGNALAGQGRTQEAIAHYTEALRINPNYGFAHNNLANVLFRQGRSQEAAAHYTEALRINPNDAHAHKNLANVLLRQGRTHEAMAHYTRALRINPNDADARNNLGNALARQGRTQEAAVHYTEALRINPNFADARNNLGNALARQGRVQEAAVHYTEALRINPNDAHAHNNLGNALDDLGRTQEAIAHYSEALRIDPNFAGAHYNLGNALSNQGRIEEAISHFTKALGIKPDLAEARFSLGVAYSQRGNRELALEEYKILRGMNPDLANTLSQKISK